MSPWTAVDDRLYQDFIEDISVTREELAALVRTPDLTVPEVKRLRAHPSPAAQARLPVFGRYEPIADPAPVRLIAVGDLLPGSDIARADPLAGAGIAKAERVELDAGSRRRAAQRSGLIWITPR